MSAVTRSVVGPLELLLHQSRYEFRAFRRNRRALVFSLLLPVLFLVVFAGVFGNGTVALGGTRVTVATYYVPGLMALAVVSSSLVNLTTSVVAERDLGVLKRRRATPVAPWVLMGARALTSVRISLLAAALLVAVGRVVYGAYVPGDALIGVAVTVMVGSASLSALGYALSTWLTMDSVQPVLQVVVLPLYFVSGVFVPQDRLPSWLRLAAEVFPIERIAGPLHHAFDPAVTGAGVSAVDLGVLAAWAAVAGAIAVRRFTWLPRAT